jgi:hypothetical protein
MKRFKKLGRTLLSSTGIMCMALTVTLCIGSCGGNKKADSSKEESSYNEETLIETTAISYLKVAMNFEYDEAQKYTSADKYESCSKAKETFNTDENTVKLFREILQAAKFKVIDKQIAADKLSAEVTVKIETRNSEINDRILSLIKENDIWKVDENVADVISKHISYALNKGFYIDDSAKLNK